LRYDTLIITDKIREDYIRHNYINNSKIEKLDEKIKELLIDYDAKSETYKELKEPKELEKLDKKFKIEHSILTKKRATYQEDLDKIIKSNLYHQAVTTGNISKMQYFMDTVKKLEGEKKNAVLHQTLVQKLCDDKSGYEDPNSPFTRESANDMIRKMLREASIYESKPGHYNRV